MKLFKNVLLIIHLFLLASCSFFWSSIVPEWYDKEYEDSQYLYGKGRGSSQREDLALKKAETAAQSDLIALIQKELEKISRQAMRSDSIAENEDAAQKYRKAILSTEQNLICMTQTANQEMTESDNICNVFILIRVSKAELEKVYLEEVEKY